MKRHLRGPVFGLALSIGIVSTGATQSIAHRPSVSERGTGLAASYRVRLESAWPQLAGSVDCENGGSETVEGVLARTASGDYSGTFTRSTRLLFCGAHGAGGGVCRLTLSGEGAVAMRGTVVEGRSLRLSWTPSPAHTADVQGACAAGFKDGVRRMYLTVPHGAEFTLPEPGAARRKERLENYAWIVEVE